MSKIQIDSLDTRPTVLIYCQHSLGMGHLVRSLALARGLTTRFDVVFLNGGRFPEAMAKPAGIEVIDLPPLGMGADASAELVSLDARYDVATAQALRQTMILDALERTRPAAIVIELFPFGRKKFANEIVPLLQAAHAMEPTARAADLFNQWHADFERAARANGLPVSGLMVSKYWPSTGGAYCPPIQLSYWALRPTLLFTCSRSPVVISCFSFGRVAVVILSSV